MIRSAPACRALYNIDVHDLATAWNAYAMGDTGVDPAIELIAVPVCTTHQRVLWRPAIRVPASRTLVVVHTAAPHITVAEACQCLGNLLLAMAAQGSITLRGRAGA